MATNSHRLVAATAALCTVFLGSAATGSAQRTAPPSGVPILMFHVIGEGSGARLPELYVSPATFRAQVDWLATHGYHAVTLDAVYRHWTSGGPLPRKPVVLSFDDGYPGDVDIAMPTLRARGWSGVLNLQVENIVPARVRLLIAAGWEIDSHTFTHPDLTHVGAAQLAERSRRPEPGSATSSTSPRTSSATPRAVQLNRRCRRAPRRLPRCNDDQRGLCIPRQRALHPESRAGERQRRDRRGCARKVQSG